MSSSTLDPDNLPDSDRQLGRGHGNDSLGPSDLSDTGSDVQGGAPAIDEFDIGLERGTNEDSDSHALHVGDDTSDSGGTGEDSTAGRNADIELQGDIGVDRIDGVGSSPDADSEADDLARHADGSTGEITDAGTDSAADTESIADLDDEVDVDAIADADQTSGTDQVPDVDADVDGDESLFDDMSYPPDVTGPQPPEPIA